MERLQWWLTTVERNESVCYPKNGLVPFFFLAFFPPTP